MKVSKIKGTLLIAVLLLTTLAIAIPTISAQPLSIDILPTSGNVGDILTISGTANVSVPIDIFWDYVKIADTSADGAGNYAVNITIPVDVNGTHIVSVKDTFHGFIDEDRFDIEPKITVTPESGLPDDPVDVAGTGFAADSVITITYYPLSIVNETLGIVTAGPGSNMSLGNTNVSDPVVLYANATTLIPAGNYTITNDLGLIVWLEDQTGDTITACYNYSMHITPETPPETSPFGSFDAVISIPDVPYENYTITAIDEDLNNATFEFVVTATITLIPDEGSSGTTVDISGIGFNGTKVEIYFDSKLLKKDVPLTDEGTFTSSFIVPTIDTGEYEVKAIDDDLIKAYLPFNVTATTQITLDPTSVS